MENVPEKRKEEEPMTNMEPIENVNVEPMTNVNVEPIDEMKIEQMEDVNIEPVAETITSLEETREPEVVPVVPVVGQESIPESEMGLEPAVKKPSSSRKKRCRKGSRRNKGSHRCRKINKKKTKRCHKGSRRNRRTHHCRKKTR
jgi:hypothetical protein